jgi:transposase-like protein
MATSQGKFGRRFDDEFKREVAALASRPGARLEQVASDLGVSPWSVSRWRRQYGSDENTPGVTALPSSSGVSVAELERRIRALERENADLREQRTILKKSGRHLLRTPALKMAMIQHLAGDHAVRKLCRTLGVARGAYYAAQKKDERPRARDNAFV